MNSEIQKTEENKDRNEKPLGARLGEAGFCVGYLFFVLAAAIIMREKSRGMNPAVGVTPDYYRYAFGFFMALLLGGGDAFHLIPRIIVNVKGKMWQEEKLLGAGNLISSITMTLFYNVLIAMGDSVEYSPTMYNYNIENAILILTIIRIVLLLFPQNKWFSKEPARTWAIIRNVPFAFIGILVVFGFVNVIQHATNYPVTFYLQIVTAVILSFAFYLPVAIFGKENPKLGMLMIPKTVCYIWMISVIAFA